MKETEDLKQDKFNHRLFSESVKATKYRLFIGGFNSIDHELDEIVNKLSKATPEDIIEVQIASPGGYTMDLMKIENVLRTYFYGRVKTILNPCGYSCGAMLFLCGDERIIYENSDIMFHNISTGTMGKLNDIELEITHNKKFFENYMSRSLSPFFSREEIRGLMEGKDFWMDALEMCERGICTGISVFGQIMEPGLYVKYRKDKKIRKELISKLKDAKDYLCLRDFEYLKYNK